MFGMQFVYGNPATSLASDGDRCIVGLRDGSTVTSRAVVIATGVSYRRLAAPELESLAGAGVFYGAATKEARALAGKRASWSAAVTRPGRRPCTCRRMRSTSRSSSARRP
jgi:thioredoxin reductase